jgi:hypothetical protein
VTMGTYPGERAERTIAAVAALSRRGARLASERIPADAFHDPRCARVVQVGCTMPDEYDRVRQVAEVAGVWPAWLAEATDQCPVMQDLAGSFAAEVVEAADRRRQALALADELERLTGRTVLVVDPAEVEHWQAVA